MNLELELKHSDPQLRAGLVAGCVERADFIGSGPSIFSSKRLGSGSQLARRRVYLSGLTQIVARILQQP